MRQRLVEFEQLCRDRNLSLTIQRRAVFVALHRDLDHPTADEVLEAVQQQLPNISRTTVYRILDEFVQLGLIIKIFQPRGAARYDVYTEEHDHLACLRCDRIIDVKASSPHLVAPADAGENGFEVKEAHVFFYGICGDCRRKEAAEAEDAGSNRTSDNEPAPRAAQGKAGKGGVGSRRPK